jgi:hypothetical protein
MQDTPKSDWDPNQWQGRTSKQVEDSENFVMGSVVCILILIIVYGFYRLLTLEG